MIPAITITGGQPTNLPPLLFVIAVSGTKDFFEDRNRRKSDAEENESKTLVWKVTNGIGAWQQVKWSEVVVGDVVQVREN